MTWTRRDALRGAMAAAVAGFGPSRRGWAFGDATAVDVAELDLGGTLTRPLAWKRVLSDLVQLTSIEARPESVVVSPEDPALFDHPFCVLAGKTAFVEPSALAVKQLEAYVSYGGFLFIDDASGDAAPGPDSFDASVRRLLSRMYPRRALAPLSPDHAIYRSFFLLSRVPGRVEVAPRLEGLTLDAHAPVVYSRNDVGGALDTDAVGLPAEPCVPGGEPQRREALKVAVNTFLYALTSDYKLDQAHVRQLLLEKRGQAP
ncbi:MAG: hypothetical protein RLZZ383_1804 [Pseudomonadota bacterium]|jgi:hypothetical protein